MQSQNGACNRSSQLFRNFYDALVLLSVLDPSALARATQAIEFKASDNNSEITKFLDRLSWMCDFEMGGSSVCAIAMQPTETDTTFWFAMQYKYVSKTRVTLDKLLGKLKIAATLSEKAASALKNEICANGIAYANPKVHYYSRNMCKLIEKIFESESTNNFQLLRDLQRLKALAGNSVELCLAADHFRDSEPLRQITQKIENRGMSDQWSSLRHSIGRLGSWHRAANTLVEYARAKPELFEAFTIKAVEMPKPIHVPSPDDSADLLSILQRMWPADQNSELLRAANALDRLRKSDIAQEFNQAYRSKTFRPRVHAEVRLLDHFYYYSLPFVEAYRYIGCSKRSCYCCDLYFKFHPGQFVRRDSHGNVWINWTPTFTENSEIRETILQQMTEIIKGDVRAQLFGHLPKQPRVPDSTTGLSNSYH